MIVTRIDEKIQIECTDAELSEILRDLWGHSMGMGQPGRDLTAQARQLGVV